MIEYVRQIKMKLTPKNSIHIKHEVVDIKIDDFNMNNFEIQANKFIKYMPFSWESGYILVSKDKVHYHETMFKIKVNVITIQFLLLLLFATLSYFLSVRALKPMQEAITKLDNFSKDLIHDLNTPITSILLNMKLLDAKEEFNDDKALLRIKRSVEDITELHKNLTVLLQEETMIMQEENLLNIVNEVVLTHKKIYRDISFEIEEIVFFAKVNRDAFKQVIVNIISNACKYNKIDGYIKIYTENRALYIEDSGLGIQNPESIFERSYKEHTGGHGIGLDIVKRLCDAMEVEILVVSTLGVGTTISLHFKD